jgi:hypothetical protein
VSENIAWAAGLFEGEGHCSLIRNYPVLALGMTDKEVVEKFVSVIGVGNIRVIDSKRANHNKIWEVRITHSTTVIEVLSMLYPYLCTRRREQADEVMKRAREIGYYPTNNTRARHKELLERWKKTQNERT